jgi:Ca2+-binding EF-hand superfamily protein
MSAQGASARGALWQAHSAADADGDGQVTLPELQAQARLKADRSAAREADIRALMALDFDQNGLVTTQELRHALSLIAPET